MSITLKQSSEVSRDCTCSFNITLSKSYTVREFIQETLKERNNEWGRIYIYRPSFCKSDARCDYKYGKLITEMDKKFLDKTIEKATCSGGWTNMNYDIFVKPK